MSRITFTEIVTTPAPPSSGQARLYVKTDNILYLQDSSGAETALGSASAITALTGDVTATGPGSVAATVVLVGGVTAANVASGANLANAATSANTASTIVRRDASGNFVASTITANLTGSASNNVLKAGDTMIGALIITNTSTSALRVGTSTFNVDTTNNRVGINNTSPTQALDVTGNILASGTIKNTDTTQSTDKDTGAIVTEGGLGVEKNINAGGNISATGTLSGSNFSGSLAGTNTGDVTLSAVGASPNANGASLSGQVLTLQPADSTNPGVLTAISQSIGGIKTFINKILVSDTTQSTDKDTGSIITEGGIGVEKNINAGGNINATGTVTGSNLSNTNTGDVTLTAVGSSPNANGASLSGQALTLQPADATNPGVVTIGSQTFSGSKTFASTTIISDTTQSTTKDTGSLVLEGGLGVEKNINAGGTIIGSNLSGANTGDVTITDSDSIDLSLTGQNLSADLKLSSDVASAGNLKATTTIHSGAGAGLHIEYPFATPVQIGTSNFVGAASSFALSDHVHNHGAQTNTTLHALATTIAHGFMSSTDKTKIDTELPASLGTANQVLGVNTGATAGEYKSLLGTTNQVVVTHGVGTVTFSIPQDIATSSTPTFAGENLTNRLEFTEQSPAPSTPASTKVDIFVEASNGFSRLRVLDSTGLKSTVFRDSFILVKNTTGSSIAAGKAVYYTGTDAGTSLPLIGLAKADSSLTVPSIGLALDTIANNGTGRMMGFGIITNIDTSAFAQGDKLYLSATTAGALTTTKPVSPNIWQRIGIVLVSNASTGSIEVRPFGTHGEESGTNTAFTLNTVTLTDAANIATDASLGNIFTVTLGGNRNLSAPTNPTNGQKVTYRITQDGTGSRGLTFDAIFRFGLDILSFTPSTGAGKTDYIGCIYNSAATKWDVVAVAKGF